MKKYLLLLLVLIPFLSPGEVDAARLKTFGFETNTITANHEFTSTSNSPTIDATTFRSDTYGGKVTGLTSASAFGFYYRFKFTVNAGPFFVRTYFQYTVLPGTKNGIMALTAGTSFAGVDAGDPNVKLDTTGALGCYQGATQIGSNSSVLTSGQWYMVEMQYDATPANGSRVIRCRLDGVEFAGSASLTLNSPNATMRGFVLGGNVLFEANTGGTYFFDDAAINDNTGSSQTSYPGSGKVLRLSPNAAGDVNTFATQTGGSAGAGNNFGRVSEISPDDATTFNGSNTTNEEDLYNVDDSGIGASDTVNVVEADVWHRASAATNNSIYKVEIEKTSGGTVSQGSAVTPSSTTFIENVTAVPLISTQILYNDPDGSPWTKTTIDSMQIGMKITTGSTNRADISTIWVYVDYTPSAAVASPPPSPRWSILRGKFILIRGKLIIK